MVNLIFGAFATLDGYREGDAANLGRTVYDRCTVVALCSAKAQNPACTVALLTNAPVPEPFRSQLTQGGVEIWDCPFTTYRVPADTNWALAYYKLCAMAWVLENRDFARAAMLDLDTFTQRPLDDLWRECDEAVLLYQVPHAASQTMTAAISRCFDAVEPDGAPHALTHFGGELVAGSRARLADFMSLCRDYFEELQERASPRGRVTRPSGAVPPTAVCWPVNPCALQMPISSATGWAGISTMYRQIIHSTPSASCICRVRRRTAS